MIRQKRRRFYGWVVVSVSFLTMVVAYSLRYNFSVFYVAILEHFRWGRGETAAGFSINLVIYSLSCPVIGYLIDRLEVRKVVPAGAILFGLTLAACSLIDTIWHFYLIIGASAFGSCCMGYVPHVPLIAEWFKRRRGLALGILSAGVPASAFFAPVVQYLITSLGWKGAFLVISAISALLLAPISAIFQRSPGHDYETDDDQLDSVSNTKNTSKDNLVLDLEWASRNWTLTNAMKEHRFWYLILMCMFIGFYTYTFLTHQIAYLIDDGFTLPFAARIVAVFSIAATVSSVFTFVADYIGREVAFTLGSGCSLAGLIVLQTTQGPNNLWMPFLYASLFGFGFGMTVALMAVTSSDLFLGERLGAINGMAMACFVTSGALGTWLAGFIYDISGSYQGIFPVMYVAISASVIFMWFASPRKVRAVPGKARSNCA